MEVIAVTITHRPDQSELIQCAFEQPMWSPEVAGEVSDLQLVVVADQAATGWACELHPADVNAAQIVGGMCARLGAGPPQDGILHVDERHAPLPGLSLGRNDPCPCGSGQKSKICAPDRGATRLYLARWLIVDDLSWYLLAERDLSAVWRDAVDGRPPVETGFRRVIGVAVASDGRKLGTFSVDGPKSVDAHETIAEHGRIGLHRVATHSHVGMRDSLILTTIQDLRAG